MIVLGIDTATPATAVALLHGDRPDAGAERRHDPGPGERPGHSAQLLVLADALLRSQGMTFGDVERIAVGVGPGGFTGLRIGVATARGLAQAAGAQLRGVSSLRALALGAAAEPGPAAGADAGPPAGRVLAVIDARRGEVFAAGFQGARELIAPVAIAPAELGAAAGPDWLAVGDGAIRFRSDLQRAGCDVPPDDSTAHRVSALAICRLSFEPAAGRPHGEVVPDYLRPPDAVKSRP